jgi:hypothetical protein
MSIGTGQDRIVQSISVLDGLTTEKSGVDARVGTEFGSTVNRLERQGGEVNAESVFGAGIGSGSANVSGHQSRVDTLSVGGANMTANSLNGPGIGSRHVAWPAISLISSIERSSWTRLCLREDGSEWIDRRGPDSEAVSGRRVA